MVLKILLEPSDWVESIAQNDTKTGGKSLPQGHQDPEPGQHKLDELVRLVEVILAGDVIFGAVARLFCNIGNTLLIGSMGSVDRGLGWRNIVIGQVEYSDQCDLTSMGRNGPDGKYL